MRLGKAYKCPQMNTIKFLVHESFEFGGFCTWPRLAVHHDISGLVGCFVKKWNSWFLRCEGWKGLQMTPNECHEVLGARMFWVRRGLLMAKVVARLVGGEFLWKNEIRGFWDVRVGKAYKCPQMNTFKFLVHESFEFGGFCTWPRLAVHHGIGRWLGGEFCETVKFVIFEIWGLERSTNVPKWIPWNSWCTKVFSSEGFAHGQGWRCTTA